jgi:two-component system phosphate regulon sensor histidine kinase PhoR
VVSPSLDRLSFRRAFLLLLLLVVLPSVGLVTFAVVAIASERAAVEKRLSDAWSGRLQIASRTLVDRLDGMLVERDGAPAFTGPLADKLAGARFTGTDGKVTADDPALEEALAGIQGELALLPDRPVLFSVSDFRQTFLLAAVRHDGQVRGTVVSLDGVDALATTLGGEPAATEGVRLELEPLKPAHRAPEGVFSRLAVQVAQARDGALGPRPIAEWSLSQPLQEFKLSVVPAGKDPVAAASMRNRTVYGVLLGVLYVLLALGVVLISRTLYREARLSRLKTDFVSLVSHELRTPLTSIRMFIETLSMGRVRDGAQTQEVLGMLAKETERLSEMIEHVLDWARIESGRKVYRREVMPVQQILDASLAAFRAQRLDVPVELSCETAQDLPGVSVDRDALAGALLNLVQNAFKYGGDPKKVAVRARSETRGVAIDVEDNGTGIAPRERRRIFERFYRVDNLLTRKSEGSGLGLSIAKRIVEAHGGRLSVKSEPGKGSCFTIHLPKAPRAARA